MKHTARVLALLLSLSLVVGVEGRRLTLDDVLSQTYAAYGYGRITPLPDGESYARLEDGGRIVRYSFRDATAQETLFDVSWSGGVLRQIDDFIVSPAGDYLLLQTETEQIYRHSRRAAYYVYKIGNRSVAPLSDGGKQQAPLFSPDGTMVAFAREGNLFLVKLVFSLSESQVTTDGTLGAVINGIPDWVNEEEFSTARSFDFSPDSRMLAWIRYDESRVARWRLQYYKNPGEQPEPQGDYPSDYDYKYPIAGTPNSTVSVHSYDIKSHVTRRLDLPLDSDGYIPRLSFSPDSSRLIVLTLNRLQNDLRFYSCNPRSGVCQEIIRETSDTYVKEDAYTQFQFAGSDIIFPSDRSGYRQLYLYSLTGSLLARLTDIDGGVVTYLGFDPDKKTYYFSGQDEGSPLRTAIYSVRQGRQPTRLTERSGTNRAVFSSGCRYYILTHSALTEPYTVTLHTSSGKTLKTLLANDGLIERLRADSIPLKEFFTFSLPDSTRLNGWICKPLDFDPSRKYPVVLFQYSGPGSQEVVDSWDVGGSGEYLESYWAQQGLITVCVDGRGTGGRGADFEKCTYRRLGQLESSDQVEVALWLSRQSYVDPDRIAIWGWSFGGFNTLMSMSEGRGVFRCGVSVAPVTSYRFYDTIYTERYMRTPQQNPDGYADNAISRAPRLHGRLLICHGLADDNVHYRNTAEYTDALIQADKQFEMQVYTNRNHFIWGGNTRHHLFTRITDFLLSNLL